MNKRTSAARLMSMAAITLLLLAALCVPALAQCAMCKASLSGSTNGAAFAKGLNLGVLVLLLPPVTMFSAIFIIAFKHRNAEKSSKDGQ